MEQFANAGGMLPEQLWDAADLPDGRMKFGQPTGSAMPLCWAHAEYIALVRSTHDGVAFDRIEPAFQRYVVNQVEGEHAIWTFRHPIQEQPPGKILRLIVEASAVVTWSADGWATTHHAVTTDIGALKQRFVDLPTKACASGAAIAFTFFWQEAERWEGLNYYVEVDQPR